MGSSDSVISRPNGLSDSNVLVYHSVRQFLDCRNFLPTEDAMLRLGLGFFDRFSSARSRKEGRLISLVDVCGVLVVCGIVLGNNALAAPPNPPVIFGDDVIVSDSNANRIDAILSRYTLPSILDGLQYPADPVTTTTYEVRTDAELSAAMGGDGRMIRIYGPANGGQATYSAFAIPRGGRSDIDIVMDNDATIVTGAGWGWWNPVRRLRWTGGNIEISGGSGNGFRIADAEDLLFDNVRMRRGGTDGHILAMQGDRHLRIAVVNSTMEFTESGPGTYYAMYSAGDPTYRGDWILLNNRFIGQGPPVRLMYNGLRTAIVGNYFSEFPNPASIRLHEESDKLWFAHNVSVHGGGNQMNFDFTVSATNFATDSILNDFLIEDNQLFATRSNINSGQVARYGGHIAELQDQATGWVIRNNTWSDPTGPAGGEPHGHYMFSVPYTAENNLRVGPGHPSYETVPSAADFGAAR